MVDELGDANKGLDELGQQMEEVDRTRPIDLSVQTDGSRCLGRLHMTTSCKVISYVGVVRSKDFINRIQQLIVEVERRSR